MKRARNISTAPPAPPPVQTAGQRVSPIGWEFLLLGPVFLVPAGMILMTPFLGGGWGASRAGALFVVEVALFLLVRWTLRKTASPLSSVLVGAMGWIWLRAALFDTSPQFFSYPDAYVVALTPELLVWVFIATGFFSSFGGRKRWDWPGAFQLVLSSILSILIPTFPFFNLLALGWAGVFVHRLGRRQKILSQIRFRFIYLASGVGLGLLLFATGSYRMTPQPLYPAKGIEFLRAANLSGRGLVAADWVDYFRARASGVFSSLAPLSSDEIPTADILVVPLQSSINLAAPWTVVFENNVAAVFVKRGSENFRRAGQYYGARGILFTETLTLAEAFGRAPDWAEEHQDQYGDAGNPPAWLLTARALTDSEVYEARGLLGRAVNVVTRRLIDDPQSEELAIRLGILFTRMADWEKAQRVLTLLDAGSAKKKSLIPLRLALYEHAQSLNPRR